MEVLLELIKNQQILNSIGRIVLAAIVALGLVYTTGRMLKITKTDLTRNIMALIVIFAFQYIYSISKYPNKEDVWIAYNVISYGAVSVVFYVLFCWRLFVRVDHFLDKKIGDSKRKKINKKKGRK